MASIYSTRHPRIPLAGEGAGAEPHPRDAGPRSGRHAAHAERINAEQVRIERQRGALPDSLVVVRSQ